MRHRFISKSFLGNYSASKKPPTYQVDDDIIMTTHKCEIFLQIISAEELVVIFYGTEGYS